MKLADLGIEKLSIEISTNCNIRCTFCPIDMRSFEPYAMPLEKIKPLLDQLAEDGTLKHVGFQFLNEPLLHPKIEDILAYSHQLGLRTFVSTNGTILNERIINMLARTSPTLMKVSLQDINPETFNTIKGTKMSFDEFKNRVVSLIRRRLTDPVFQSQIEFDVAVPIRKGRTMVIRRSWMEKLLGVALTDQTINDADDVLLEYLRDFLKYVEMHAQAPIDWSNLITDLDHIKTWKADYMPTARLGPGITLELKGFYDWIGIDSHRPVAYGACPRLNQVIVNYKGNFQLCCVDTHGKTAIGNVFNKSIQWIISQPESVAKLLRAPGYELPTEHCRTCVGASTRRGVAFLNLKNLLWARAPRFVPERRRDCSDSLARLRRHESGRGNERVAGAIDESLGLALPAAAQRVPASEIG